MKAKPLTLAAYRTLFRDDAQRIPRSVRRLFEFLDLLLPKRLREEELPDAYEVIHSLLITEAPHWKIYTKTLSTMVWCLLNAVGYVVATILGRNKAKS